MLFTFIFLLLNILVAEVDSTSRRLRAMTALLQRKAPMSYYRVESLDDAGNVVALRYLECVSDDEVIAQAVQLCDDHPTVEIWDGQRVVGTFTTTKPP